MFLYICHQPAWFLTRLTGWVHVQGMASNLLEVTWKGHLRLLHESPTAYSSFMGDVATYTGVMTMGMMVRGSSLVEHPGLGLGVGVGAGVGDVA